MSPQDRKGWLFEKSWPSSGRDCHFYGWANYGGRLIQGFCERINGTMTAWCTNKVYTTWKEAEKDVAALNVAIAEERKAGR